MEEEDQYYSLEEDNDAVLRFEEMLKDKKRCFFDVHEFEEIIDFYIDNCKYGDALYAVTIASSQHPGSSSLQLKKARALMNSGKLFDALNILRLLENIEKTNYEIFMLKGSVLLQCKDHKGAILQFEKVIELCKKDGGEDIAEVFMDIASCFIQSGDVKTAVSFLEKAYKEDPVNKMILFELAGCYDYLKFYDKSIALYNAYLEDHPFSKIIWNILGTAYRFIKMYDKALEAFDYAIAINEKYYPAYFNKAGIYSDQGNIIEALDVYDELLRIDPENLHALYYSGECYEKLEDIDNAEVYYKKVIEIDDRFADGWFGLGVVNLYKGKFFESLYALRKAVKIDGNNPEYWFFLGKTNASLDFMEDAVRAYKKAVALDPYDDEFWICYSDLFYRYDRIDDAIDILKEGYDFNTDNADISFRLAAYLLKSRNPDQALIYLKKGLLTNHKKLEVLFDIYPEAIQNDRIKNMISGYK